MTRNIGALDTAIRAILGVACSSWSPYSPSGPIVAVGLAVIALVTFTTALIALYPLRCSASTAVRAK